MGRIMVSRHLIGSFCAAAGLAHMVRVAAEAVPDPETKAGLIAVARAVDGYIEAGVAMAAVKLGK